MKHVVCVIFELAPYRSKQWFVPGVRGVERTALLMLTRMSSVHIRCTFGHRDDMRAVPR